MRPLLVAACLLALTLPGARPAAAALLDLEYEAAQKQVGRARMLSQRLSKQNVLYQLHLADQHKLQLVETARQLDDTLVLIRDGDATIGVPRPPTPEIQRQVAEMLAAWAPLEQMVLSSPYDYLRRSREWIDPRSGRGDPLRIAHFDRMAMAFGNQVERTTELYRKACVKDQYTNCQELSSAGVPEMLAERLLKEAVMLFAGMEDVVSAEKLQATRDEFDALLAAIVEIDAVKRASAPERGATGAYVRSIVREIQESWRMLGREVELVVRGHAEEANLRRALAVQEIVVDDVQRLRVAIEQAIGAGYQ